MIVTLIKHGKDGRVLYYTIHDRQQSLLSPYVLTTVFRNGSGKERERHRNYDNLAEMDARIRGLLALRIRDGYRLLYSWSRDASWADPAKLAENRALKAGLLSRAGAARDDGAREATN